jgi:DNA invertase Pin-like site-specific DNA recombinase
MLQGFEDCVGYCRVSTQRQFVEGHGLERYIDALKRYGLREEQIYWDVESGASDKRTGYNQVLNLIKQGNIKKLIVPCFDRFTRSVDTWETVREELQKHKVTIIMLDGGSMKFETPEELLNSRIQVAFAAMTRDKNKYNSIQGFKFFRSQEKALQAVFGYLKVGDTLIVNHTLYKTSSKTYFAVARELIELFLTNRTLAGTIRIFCAKYGYESTRAKTYSDHPHSHTGLKSWLLHPLLRGNLVYFNKIADKRLEIPNKFEAILSELEYLEILRIFEQSPITKGKNVKLVNPLMGIAFCAGCGSRMRSRLSSIRLKDGTTNHHYYMVCKGANPESGQLVTCDRKSSYSLTVQDCVDKVISALCLKADEIAIQAVSLDAPNQEETPEIKELRAQIHKLCSLNDHDLVEIIKVKQTKLENLLLGLKTQVAGNDARYELMKQYAAMPQLWKLATVEEQFVLFQDLVKRVTCDYGVVTVELLI